MGKWALRLSVTISTVLAAITVGPAAHADAAVDYVALGDSYSSGTGATGATGTCMRSPNGYPQLWADRNDPSSFEFVACGGATTDDVRATQVAALDDGTDLVTITIGGNDAGFATGAISCVLGSDEVCLGVVEAARVYIRTQLPGRLDRTYADITGRAPSAQVVVLGYPRLFETGACPGGLSLAKRRALNAAADDLATVTRERAEAAGLTWADTRPIFAGHGVCSATPWINRVNLLNLTSTFHPNNAGYASGYLPTLESVTG
ncbi:SGNH/GDSL hydrolase family protein [Catenuloplanes atrovinosus]|uniref:Lysophospholipase L1-like esterase n=1 Tax=Catenuloplanes atrovinosus TaxID=137266 RepID=A0AAE3YVW7_9ACTN|nr:SGNH/GDSL hydrolase family protein [Catenuloplanes atrovinosus]MDR7280853.1 lysophospholipase L1-like esterase [Catenuloplanes atrovinosus]